MPTGFLQASGSGQCRKPRQVHGFHWLPKRVSGAAPAVPPPPTRQGQPSREGSCRTTWLPAGSPTAPAAQGGETPGLPQPSACVQQLDRPISRPRWKTAAFGAWCLCVQNWRLGGRGGEILEQQTRYCWLDLSFLTEQGVPGATHGPQLPGPPQAETDTRLPCPPPRAGSEQALSDRPRCKSLGLSCPLPPPPPWPCLSWSSRQPCCGPSARRAGAAQPCSERWASSSSTQSNRHQPGSARTRRGGGPLGASRYPGS